MSAPTPIGTHRRYTKRQKATAVIAAEMATVEAASEQMGIPRSTLRRWMDDPDMVELRQKTREERAEAASAMSMVVLGEIKRRLPEFEPRDLATLYGVLTDKSQLLSGAATVRTETVTGALNDHEKAQLREVLQRALAERGTP